LWSFWERLEKINNELEVTNHYQRSAITPKDIEENIGFSKDFNVFELKAIGERNQLKAYTIAENFKQSERNPWWLPLVWFFFYTITQIPWT
jgi:DNA polymerase-3 subunit delta